MALTELQYVSGYANIQKEILQRRKQQPFHPQPRQSFIPTQGITFQQLLQAQKNLILASTLRNTVQTVHPPISRSPPISENIKPQPTNVNIKPLPQPVKENVSPQPTSIQPQPANKTQTQFPISRSELLQIQKTLLLNSTLRNSGQTAPQPVSGNIKPQPVNTNLKPQPPPASNNINPSPPKGIVNKTQTQPTFSRSEWVWNLKRNIWNREKNAITSRNKEPTPQPIHENPNKPQPPKGIVARTQTQFPIYKPGQTWNFGDNIKVVAENGGYEIYVYGRPVAWYLSQSMAFDTAQQYENQIPTLKDIQSTPVNVPALLKAPSNLANTPQNQQNLKTLNKINQDITSALSYIEINLNALNTEAQQILQEEQLYNQPGTPFYHNLGFLKAINSQIKQYNSSVQAFLEVVANDDKNLINELGLQNIITQNTNPLQEFNLILSNLANSPVISSLTFQVTTSGSSSSSSNYMPAVFSIFNSPSAMQGFLSTSPAFFTIENIIAQGTASINPLSPLSSSITSSLSSFSGTSTGISGSSTGTTSIFPVTKSTATQYTTKTININGTKVSVISGHPVANTQLPTYSINEREAIAIATIVGSIGLGIATMGVGDIAIGAIDALLSGDLVGAATGIATTVGLGTATGTLAGTATSEIISKTTTGHFLTPSQALQNLEQNAVLSIPFGFMPLVSTGVASAVAELGYRYGLSSATQLALKTGITAGIGLGSSYTFAKQENLKSSNAWIYMGLTAGLFGLAGFTASPTRAVAESIEKDILSKSTISSTLYEKINPDTGEIQFRDIYTKVPIAKFNRGTFAGITYHDIVVSGEIGFNPEKAEVSELQLPNVLRATRTAQRFSGLTITSDIAEGKAASVSVNSVEGLSKAIDITQTEAETEKGVLTVGKNIQETEMNEYPGGEYLTRFAGNYQTFRNLDEESFTTRLEGGAMDRQYVFKLNKNIFGKYETGTESIKPINPFKNTGFGFANEQAGFSALQRTNTAGAVSSKALSQSVSTYFTGTNVDPNIIAPVYNPSTYKSSSASYSSGISKSATIPFPSSSVHLLNVEPTTVTATQSLVSLPTTFNPITSPIRTNTGTIEIEHVPSSELFFTSPLLGQEAEKIVERIPSSQRNQINSPLLPIEISLLNLRQNNIFGFNMNTQEQEQARMQTNNNSSNNFLGTRYASLEKQALKTKLASLELEEEQEQTKTLNYNFEMPMVDIDLDLLFPPSKVKPPIPFFFPNFGGGIPTKKPISREPTRAYKPKYEPSVVALVFNITAPKSYLKKQLEYGGLRNSLIRPIIIS